MRSLQIFLLTAIIVYRVNSDDDSVEVPVEDLIRDGTDNAQEHERIATNTQPTAVSQPNLLRLPKDMVNLLNEHKFTEANVRTAQAINDSIYLIRDIALNVLNKVVNENLLLVASAQPGKWCVELMRQHALEIIEYMVHNKYLNTNEYKYVDWARRSSVLHMANKNILSSICAYERGLYKFVRHVCYDVTRNAHIGLGLVRISVQHPRYIHYTKHCMNISRSYKKENVGMPIGPAFDRNARVAKQNASIRNMWPATRYMQRTANNINRQVMVARPAGRNAKGNIRRHVRY